MSDINTENQNRKDITLLQKEFAVMNVKVDTISQYILEIKNNHLLHINDQLRVLSESISSNNVELTKLLNDKTGDIYSKLTDLRIKDARTEPSTNILNKVIEYVILAVIGAGVALLITHS